MPNRAKIEKQQSDTPTFDSLSQKQQNLILNYVDPGSETYDNQTRSYLAAYPHATYATAATEAHKSLKNPRIRTAAQEILDKLNMGYEVRLAQVAGLAHGATQTTVIETRDDTGRLKGTQTIRKPVPASDQLKAHKLLNDLSGDSALARAQNKVLSDSVMALGRKMLQQASKTTNPEERSASGPPRGYESDSDHVSDTDKDQQAHEAQLITLTTTPTDQFGTREPDSVRRARGGQGGGGDILSSTHDIHTPKKVAPYRVIMDDAEEGGAQTGLTVHEANGYIECEDV